MPELSAVPASSSVARMGGVIANNSSGMTSGVRFNSMIANALGVAYYLDLAYTSKAPEQFFYPFLGLFVILFAASGIGSGSTFRSVPIIFNKEQTSPVLGWIAAMGAYGAFIIPSVFGGQIKAGTAENALYGFAVFCCVCLLINWWFYLGPKTEFKSPWAFGCVS